MPFCGMVQKQVTPQGWLGSTPGGRRWAVENSRKSRDVAPLHFCCARENAQKMAAWRGATEVEGLKTGPPKALFKIPEFPSMGIQTRQECMPALQGGLHTRHDPVATAL